MIVYLLVRRKAQNIFLEADEADKVFDIKLMVQGILKVEPSCQKLYYLQNEDAISEDISKSMEDENRLNEYLITSSSAKAHTPARIGLVLMQDNGSWEPLEQTPYSNPPPLPDIMKAPNPTDDSNKQWEDRINFN